MSNKMKKVATRKQFVIAEDADGFYSFFKEEWSLGDGFRSPEMEHGSLDEAKLFIDCYGSEDKPAKKGKKATKQDLLDLGLVSVAAAEPAKYHVIKTGAGLYVWQMADENDAAGDYVACEFRSRAARFTKDQALELVALRKAAFICSWSVVPAEGFEIAVAPVAPLVDEETGLHLTAVTRARMIMPAGFEQLSDDLLIEDGDLIFSAGSGQLRPALEREHGLMVRTFRFVCRKAPQRPDPVPVRRRSDYDLFERLAKSDGVPVYDGSATDGRWFDRIKGSTFWLINGIRYDIMIQTHPANPDLDPHEWMVRDLAGDHWMITHDGTAPVVTHLVDYLKVWTARASTGSTFRCESCAAVKS